MSSGKGLFTITFKGVDELLRVAERQKQLLDANVRAAVARTVLWGAARIAEECPVDTGRLRASILGYLVQKYGLSVEGDSTAIAEGQEQSLTRVEGYEGRIGTNVAYAALVDYGLSGEKRKPLTRKQLRYLFYKGILKRGQGKEVIYTYKRKKAMIRGFFRNNIPVIDVYFQGQMRRAIHCTECGELMPVTF